MSIGAILAVAVIVFLIIILFLTFNSNFAKDVKVAKDALTASPRELYNDTVGHVNDTTAKLALDAARKANEERPSAESAFILGNLFRFNILADQNLGDEIVQRFYEQTLANIAEDPQENLEEAQFMIDRIEDFYETQPRGETAEVIPIVRDVVLTEQRREANRQEPQYQTRQEKYFRGGQKHTPDPQNVHDSQVNAELRKLYKKIRNKLKQPEIQQQIGEIEVYVRGADISEDKRARALQTIGVMRAGGSISNLGDTEDRILVNVWQRIMDDENEDQQDNLRSALVESLADCVESTRYNDKYQVCAGGRTARVLNSLVLLDADPEVAKPLKSKEILRNESLESSYAVLQRELKNAEPAVVKAYNEGTEDEKLLSAVADFEKHVKGKIKEKLALDYPDLPKKEMSDLLQNVYAGV